MRYLYCAGVISGYSDGTFRPYNNVTRAQLCKIVVLAEGWQDNCPTPGHFTDVPPGSTFFCYVETAFAHGVISGYTSSPPCTTGVPCFLPANSVTRGQTSKFIANAFFPGCQTPQR